MKESIEFSKMYRKSILKTETLSIIIFDNCPMESEDGADEQRRKLDTNS